MYIFWKLIRYFRCHGYLSKLSNNIYTNLIITNIVFVVVDSDVGWLHDVITATETVHDTTGTLVKYVNCACFTINYHDVT